MTDKITSRDARADAAVEDIRRELVHRGVNPDVAQDAAEGARDRLFFGSPKSPPRVLERGTLSSFMPGSFEHPFAGLISELFHGISPEYKLVATELQEARVQELVEQKIANGENRL